MKALEGVFHPVDFGFDYKLEQLAAQMYYFNMQLSSVFAAKNNRFISKSMLKT